MRDVYNCGILTGTVGKLMHHDGDDGNISSHVS